MSKDFWTGLFLSVPLSIMANLLVDPIKRLWAKLRKSQKVAVSEGLKREYQQTVTYRDNPHLFDKMMFHCLIMFASGCARVGVAVTIVFVLRVLLGPGRAAYWLYLIVGCFALSEFQFAANECRDVLAIWGRVWHFHNYKRRLPAEITETETNNVTS